METRFSGTAGEIARYLDACGTEPVNIPVLQPADPFLDMAGEDLRSRIFLTESETGESLCLRPEFTIPVCLDHIRSNSETPRRYGYLGEVYRQRREGGTGFLQAGIEDLGDPDWAASDARSIAEAYGLLRKTLPDVELSTTMGDQAVFDAVLAALGLPRGWQRRLARAFGSASQLEAALAELAKPRGRGALSGTPAELAAMGDQQALCDHIAAEMAEAGLSPTAGRTATEIAARMIEKHQLSAVELSATALAALREFLAIRVPLSQAVEALAGYAGRSGLVLDKGIRDLRTRVDAIADRGLDLDGIIYDCAFGRPLDYYTGLVFEIAGGEARGPLVGGGRYDRLLTMLGSASAIPGVGFSVWLDRIDALAGRQ